MTIQRDSDLATLHSLEFVPVQLYSICMSEDEIVGHTGPGNKIVAPDNVHEQVPEE